MCSYCVIASLQWFARKSFENVLWRRKKKGKRKSKQKKGRRRKEKGEGRGQGRNCLADYKQYKSSHIFFQNSTFCLCKAVAFSLQSRRGNPVLKTQQSQFCSDFHSEGLPTSQLWCSPAKHTSLHMLPPGFTQVPGSLACNLV